MDLARWIETRSGHGNPAAFARAHKKQKGTIGRHLTGRRFPEAEWLDFYWNVSDGKVTPNDFYRLRLKRATQLRPSHAARGRA